MAAMSAPAAKAFSLPVMTMQPTPASASAARRATPSWSINSLFSALSCLGRFNRSSAVRRAPSPRCSVKTRGSVFIRSPFGVCYKLSQ
jgi:hypothetical protein